MEAHHQQQAGKETAMSIATIVAYIYFRGSAEETLTDGVVRVGLEAARTSTVGSLRAAIVSASGVFYARAASDSRQVGWEKSLKRTRECSLFFKIKYRDRRM